MAMVMLAAVNIASPSCGRPVANIWWTHRPKPRNPVATGDSTIARCPNTGRRAKVATMLDTIPSAGGKMM